MRAIELAAFVLCFALAPHARADSSPIDPTFGANGRVSTNFVGETSMSKVNGAVLQPDGKLVVAGAGSTSTSSGFGVARLNPDGTPDPQFNGTGQVTIGNLYGAANAVALQPDGKIVAAGGRDFFGFDTSIVVARFLPDGTLDATFNSGGTLTTTVSNVNAVGSAVVVQADGKIVVAATGGNGSALIRYNSDGSLDSTFGAEGTGIVSLNAFGGQATIVGVAALALQPDGKIVTAGTSLLNPLVHGMWIARFTSSGTLDSSFNGTGTVIVGFTGIDVANAVALQADGRVVVAGTALDDIALVRLNTDGTLDASFGSNGTLRTSITGHHTEGRAVGILGDGRIVVVGTGSGLYSASSSLVMARYTANGVLDASLAGTGIVIWPDPSYVSAFNLRYGGTFVVAQGDGRVVAGGSVTGNGGLLMSGTVLRLFDDGSFDPSFGNSGVVTTSGRGSNDTLYALATRSDKTLVAAGSSDGKFAVAAYGADGALDWARLIAGSGASARAVLEQPDAKVVLAGSNGAGPTGTTFTVIRLSSTGELDPAFNGTGRVETVVGGIGSAGFAAALQPDGKIVVAGSALDGSSHNEFALVRYNTDGTLDATFGSGGQVLTPMDVSSEAHAIALQADGRIVAAGSTTDGTTIRFAIVRYQGNGSLDPTFGIGGKSSLAVGLGNSSARAIAIQGDGKIVLAGTAANPVLPIPNPVFGVVRLNVDGSPDPGFGSGGSVTTAMPNIHLTCDPSAVALLDDGRILVGGSGAPLGTRTFALARYLPDGSLDPTFGTGGKLEIAAGTNSDVSTLTGTFALQDTARAVLGGTVDSTANFDLVRVFLDDIVPPDTNLVATPGATSGPSVMFSFIGTDVGGSDVASFECALDGAQFASCTSPTSYTGVPVGSHTFQVRARDGAGNVDATPASYAWNVVLQPQAITFAQLPSRVLTASPFPLSATGGDSGNPVVFSSLTPSSCTTSGTNGATATLVAIGTCTIAADQAGNASYLAAPQVTRSFEVFATGFNLTVSRSGNGSGQVTSTPLGIDCGATCDWTFAEATVVTLAATPAAGSVFVRWTGACSGSGPCSIPMDAAKSVDATFADPTKLARLINISTRGQVQTGFDVMIGGFVIGGLAPKTVVIRAIGPSLTNYGVPGALPNPMLQLVRESDHVIVASNDNWGSAFNASTLEASGFAPANPLESAIYITLQPGAYTAIVSGIGGTGVGLVEVYEIDHPEVPFINISTRGKVLTDFDVMIGGFVISGSDPQTVVVRGIGPSLANYGVAGPLANPKLQIVRSSDQALIATNDDWGSDPNAAQVQSSGFAPSDALESAIYITLQPGAYTAILSGVDGGTGVGLVEVYAVGP